MQFIEWEDCYSVGVPDFDEHHRHLFDLLNKGYNACMVSKQNDVFRSILSELAEYACYHFTAEERLMEELSYPGLASHRQEHALFSGKISEFLKIVPSDKNECTLELVELTQFLIDWLTHHILEIDKQYTPLLARGTRG